MDERKLFAIIYTNEQNVRQIVSITESEEQASQILQKLLHDYDNIKSEQVQIEEYFLKNIKKVLDYCE